jgi:restriction system protein
MEREARAEYQRRRQQEVDSANRHLERRIGQLQNLLGQTLSTEPFNFGRLKLVAQLPIYDPLGVGVAAPKPRPDDYLPKPPGLFARLIPGSEGRFQSALRNAEQKYEEAARTYAAHEAECQRIQSEVEAQHLSVDAGRAAYTQGDPSAVIDYFSHALNTDELPEDFPRVARVGYIAESKQLVVERQLPTIDAIPQIVAYRYVRSRDAIETGARPIAQSRALYNSIVAQMAIRTLHVVFAADVDHVLSTVVLNCFVDTVDPPTGQRVQPTLLSVRTSADIFAHLDLSHVDPVACVKGLNAHVSRSPHELVAVKPIVEFNMVDPRFIASTDVLAQLDQRPNLAELTPGEFEALITNLFEKMGLETRLTQASRDCGVDCVAWDTRPVLGGKVIVQAKRYKHTVGVSAVRDLYGTVHNEGAAKGILVSTSGYGKSAYEFAQNKPLELITGSNLLFLLEEHTGLKAKIEFPETWVDPVPDAD